MFYRLSGIHHTRYESASQLWPIPADRWQVYALLALALAAPLLVSDLYLTSYLLPWLIMTSAALSLTLLMGIAGQLHFGFAAVMAIGAYTSIHLVRFGLPFELALLGAGLMAALIGGVFGAAALRVKGLYLVMATLAMQYLVDWIIVNVPAISGGAQATLLVPRPHIFGIPLVTDQARYWTAAVFTLLVALFVANVRRTDVGRALIALREKDYAAAVIGINVFYYKALAFFVSSFIGGMSGAALAFLYYRAVTPEQFGLNVSIMAVAMVIVGGLGSIIGSFFGAGFILLAPIWIEHGLRELAAALSVHISPSTLAHLPLVIYGGLITGFLLLEPLGLAKLYDNVRNYLRVWPFGYTKK